MKMRLSTSFVFPARTADKAVCNTDLIRHLILTLFFPKFYLLQFLKFHFEKLHCYACMFSCFSPSFIFIISMKVSGKNKNLHKAGFKKLLNPSSFCIHCISIWCNSIRPHGSTYWIQVIPFSTWS